MAVAPTGNIFKALSFDNVSSRTYGVYITGEAVYNAPEREVEMISIPGRNGAFALDKGRFENIEVTYPAGIFADSETNFADAISEFRNFLCSRKGYVRLQDEYNPNEYRMAIYKSGLEVEPAQLKAGEFEITFDCKPQRFLTSGETTSNVRSGDTITNPTLFEASPLILLRGYGTLTINNAPIVVDSTPFGNIRIANPKTEQDGSLSITLQTSNLNSGDSFYVNDASVWMAFTRKAAYTNIQAEVTSQTNCIGTITSSGTKRELVFDEMAFEYGTANTVSASFVSSLEYTFNGSSTTQTLNFNAQAAYNGSNTLTISLVSVTTGAPFNDGQKETTCGSIYANSTKSANNVTIYIDLDIGEAWTGTSNKTSLNNVVQLPAKLPTLTSGANTITYDNTLNNVNIEPRWWKV